MDVEAAKQLTTVRAKPLFLFVLSLLLLSLLLSLSLSISLSVATLRSHTLFLDQSEIDFRYHLRILTDCPSSTHTHTQFHLDAGVHGFYLCGNTGEGFYASIEERKVQRDSDDQNVSHSPTVPQTD